VNKKQLEKDMIEAIEKALKHEDLLQHDDNDKPVTFADES